MASGIAHNGNSGRPADLSSKDRNLRLICLIISQDILRVISRVISRSHPAQVTLLDPFDSLPRRQETTS
jgi:hypothetical protein